MLKLMSYKVSKNRNGAIDEYTIKTVSISKMQYTLAFDNAIRDKLLRLLSSIPQQNIGTAEYKDMLPGLNFCLII
jgi:hypothetical protein